MKATIWHNPKCGTSRKTLAILEETPGVQVTVIEYLKNPPGKDKLAQLFRDGNMGLDEALRVRGSPAEELGLTKPGVTLEQAIAHMVDEPILINRPIVETDKGVLLCRPQERVRDIL